MLRGTLLFLLLFSFIIAHSQENKLDEFVANQQTKLVYDQSMLVQAPNTSVHLIPPEYFIEDPTINGYVHPGSATTIQIIEVPGSSIKLIDASMTKEYIESQDYKFKERIDITTENGKAAIIYFVTFFSNDVEYERVMFFTENENTIWINVNYPLSIKKLIYPSIEACLKSVQ